MFFFFKTLLLLISVILLFSSYEKSSLFINNISKAFTILSFIIVTLGTYKLISSFINNNTLNFDQLETISLSFGNKNIYSQVLLLSIPFSFYTLTKKQIIWKTIAIINIFLTALLITGLITRSVWVAAAFSFITTLTIGFFTSKGKNINIKKYILITIPLIVTIIITIAFLSKKETTTNFKLRTESFFKLNSKSLNDRYTLWINSLDLAKEKPIFGHGAGSWKVNILKYGNQNLKSEDNLTFFQRPHNDYLWILCEQGIIALICYILIFLFFIHTAIKLLKSKCSKEYKKFILLMIFALISYLTFSFFSFPLERPEFVIFLSVTFASLLILRKKYIEKEKQTIKIKIRYFIFPIFIILIFTTLAGYSRFKSETHLKKAYHAKANNNWNKLISEIEKSEKNIYQIDPFSTPLLWYKGLANFSKGNLSQAHADFSKAYKVNPYHIHVLNNLATCKGLAKDYNTALNLYKKALDIAPNFEDAIFNICGVYYQLNDINNALTYIKTIKKPLNKERYNQIVYVLVKHEINQIQKEIKNKKQLNYIKSLKENKKETIKLFQKAIKNKKTIKQILLNKNI